MRKLLALLLSFAISPALAAVPPVPPGAPTPKATTTQISAPLQINACGDSLTVGGQDGLGGSYPSQLFADSTFPVNNFGISGQLSTQVAMRCGAIQIQLTVAGNTLTAGGASNTITAINSVAPVGTNTSNSPDYRFLSTSADNGTRIIYGSLCGTHGYVRRNANGGPPSTSETYSYFIDYANGLNSQTQALACAANSVFTPDAAKNLGQGMIFEGGRNNYTATSVVESDWGSVATAQPSTNYLMLTILNGDYASEQSGQGNYNTIITDNTFLSSTYPNNTWDWRPWLISQYSPANVVDVLNHTNDVVPYTLRAQIGSGTLNGSITSSGCPTLTQTTGTLAASQTLKVDSEYIYVLTISGSVVSTCTRGYGTGGVAASHSNGAAYTLVDPLHLSSAAYQLVGDYINAHYLTLLQSAASAASYVAPTNLSSVIGENPPPIGSVYAPTIIGGQLFAGGNIRLPYGSFFQTFDGSASGGSTPGAAGNIVNVARYVNNVLYFGGGFVSAVCVGTGGTGGLCSLGVANNGGTQYSNEIEDLGYAYSTPSTGGTVTIADTSDFAVIDPAGTLATLTVNLPTCSSTFNGKIAGFSSSQVITALTLSATAGSVKNTLSALSAGQAASFICRGANTTWYDHQ